MTWRITAALTPLLFLLAGCVDDPHQLLVANNSPVPPGTPPPGLNPERLVQRAPETEETARRVIAVSQKVILANPQLGMRPLFITAGSPDPEVFHRGGKTEGYQVFVSEGLVKQCKTDDQLAAVLCIELGKMVAERETVASAASKPSKRRLPPEERIGNDSGGTFGSADGTRLMELARLEESRKVARHVPPPAPEVLGREYLRKAGFETIAIAEVGPLLRKAEDHYAVEKQVRGPRPG